MSIKVKKISIQTYYLPKFWISHGKRTESPITTLKVCPRDNIFGIIPKNISNINNKYKFIYNEMSKNAILKMYFA